ncbi:MAG: type IV secretory system conjugative DNA transfer family protein [Sphingobium sp.]|jgi:type IV secretion system protein VirD4|nr:type IV secretory system conjugative DNA transfer family protein [Sphingobium sp.]
MKTRKLLRYPGPAHLLTIAPTRTGKGVGTIIPNLLDYPDPGRLHRPQGRECHRITARERARFGPVHVLDPFGVTGQPSAAFNPLEGIAWEVRQATLRTNNTGTACKGITCGGR